MLPATVTLGHYLYPLGNTTPNNLAATLPAGADTKILLLGCGDIRNILFTVYCSGQSSSGEGEAKIDFTCCDIEPAIIARNVLILCAILEDKGGKNDELTWQIYYHVFISNGALKLLQKLIDRLLPFTSSLEQWAKSPYGTHLRILNEETLKQLRIFWTRYATEPVPKKKDIKALMKAELAATTSRYRASGPLMAARSAGPLVLQARETASILHQHYWQNGVVWGPGKNAGNTNPMMLFSGVRGTEFAVHHGTDPALPFHLAPVFADLDPSDPLFWRPAVGNVPVKNELAMRVAHTVKLQFGMWCAAFRKRLSVSRKDNRFLVRFVIGNALSVCSALTERRLKKKGAATYSRQFTFSPMLLNLDDYPEETQTGKETAPTVFDVIDTSNLTDFVGLVNLLVVVIPCLAKGRHSSLFIETLHLEDVGKGAVEVFSRLLQADQTAMFLLLGIAPLGYLTGVGTQSTTLDTIWGLGGDKSSQGHRRSEWKLLNHGKVHEHRFGMKPKFLAKFLLGLYLEMFAVDGVAAFLDHAHARKRSKFHSICYTRASFAHFLLFLSSRITIDWEKTIELLRDAIDQDRTLELRLSMRQDLCLQLHVLGLCPFTLMTFTDLEGTMASLSLRVPGPRVLCVNLIVPREKLQALIGLGVDTIGTPILKAALSNPASTGALHYFFNLQIGFGSVNRVIPPCIEVGEDPKGWQGESNMIVSFLAPAWMLQVNTLEVFNVFLGLQLTPTTKKLVPMFGTELKLFETSVAKGDHVIITEKLPGMTAPTILAPIIQSEEDLKHMDNGVLILGPEVQMENDGQHIDTIMFRLELQDEDLKTRLAEIGTSAVKEASITTTEGDTHSIRISLSKWTGQLVFPYPINADKTRLVAFPKQSWIQVIAYPWVPSHHGCFTDTPFHTIISPSTGPQPLNTPKLPLSLLPALDPLKKHAWLDSHAGTTLSARERILQAIPIPDRRTDDGLLAIKEDMHIILLSMSDPDLRPKSFINPPTGGTIFSLTNPGTGSSNGMRFLIFVSCVRLELASHTVVADTHIIHTSLATLRALRPFLNAHEKEITELHSTDKGLKMWSHVLAASIERCREGIWSHDAEKCEYIKTKKSPLSTSMNTTPFCSCGKGKASATEKFMAVKEFKSLVPIVYRAAIGQIFPVPYFEPLFRG